MLDDIKKTLWATADKLRANMDAAEYKHLVLGLIFVKYISDTFSAKRTELTKRFADPAGTIKPLLNQWLSAWLVQRIAKRSQPVTSSMLSKSRQKLKNALVCDPVM